MVMAPWDAAQAWQTYRTGDWAADAACAGQHVNPDLWFQPRQEDRAKRVCRGCPVWQRCATWALEAPVRVAGVWGGLSEDDRQELTKPEAGLSVTKMSRQEREYRDLRVLGLSDLAIMRRSGVSLEAFSARLRRWGIPRSAELEEAIRESRRTGMPV